MRTRLVDRIRQQLDAGALPTQHPKQLFGGYGIGDACSGCGDQMVGRGVFEFEIDGRTYRLHTRCYGLWQRELIHRGLFTPR
jgi:hypothetical protein